MESRECENSEVLQQVVLVYTTNISIERLKIVKYIDLKGY